MGLFPYSYRPGQRELIGFIDRCLLSGSRAVIEAGTGTGKTVTSLCGTLPYVLEHGKKLIYLTRTKSQQRQVVNEASRLGSDILCVGMQGRTASSCPMMRDDLELSTGTPEEISKLCSEYKRMDQGRCHCPFYNNLGSTDIQEWIGRIRHEGLDPEEFAALAEGAGLCPYELMKRILPHADIIAVPYPFIFLPQVLRRFQEWVGTSVDDMVMIVDEAHNLPDYLRDVQTHEYTRNAMTLVIKEAKEHGDPHLHNDITVCRFAEALMSLLDDALEEYLIDEDGMLPPGYLEEGLMERLRVNSVTISRICNAMEEFGEALEELKKQRRKLPRSYIGSMARFIRRWIDSNDGYHVRLVVGGRNPRFQSYCLDPSNAAAPLNECASSIHMSGTLEPLDSYIEEMGLKDAVKLRMPSCFNPDNLLTIHSDDVSMRYDDRSDKDNYDRLTQLVIDVVNGVHVNTAVFFPSFQFMDRMVEDGLSRRLGRDVFYERKGMKQTELMEVFEDFRSSEGSVFFCVTGGRISEGMDFPDKSLELEVILGIPYPRPTARLRALDHYYTIRFGDGYRFVSQIPAVRKLRQTVGRLIRSETDRGVAVILDRRVAGLKGFESKPSADPVLDVAMFFNNQRSVQ